MGIYFILCVIIQYYIVVLLKLVRFWPKERSTFSWLLYPFGIPSTL